MANWGFFDELNSLRREIDDAFRVAGVARPLATTFLAPQSARRFPLINLSEDEGQICLDALPWPFSQLAADSSHHANPFLCLSVTVIEAKNFFHSSAFKADSLHEFVGAEIVQPH